MPNVNKTTPAKGGTSYSNSKHRLGSEKTESKRHYASFQQAGPNDGTQPNANGVTLFQITRGTDFSSRLGRDIIPRGVRVQWSAENLGTRSTTFKVFVVKYTGQTQQGLVNVLDNWFQQMTSAQCISLNNTGLPDEDRANYPIDTERINILGSRTIRLGKSNHDGADTGAKNGVFYVPIRQTKPLRYYQALDNVLPPATQNMSDHYYVIGYSFYDGITQAGYAPVQFDVKTLAYFHDA